MICDCGVDNLYKVGIVGVSMRWSVLVLLGIFLFSFAGVRVSAVGEGDIIAYWQMEDSAEDSAPLGNHDGSWSGTELYSDKLERVGQAAHLSGAEMIAVPDADDLSFDSSFTIEMWVKSVSSLTATLFEKGNYKIGWVKIDSSTGRIDVSVAGSTLLNSGALAAADAYHVALVWNAVDGKMFLYVDKVKAAEVEFLSSVSAAGALKIGEGFTGLIDEVAIFGAALSEADIVVHYDLSNGGRGYLDLSSVAGGSSTRTDFSVAGCSFASGLDLASGTCSSDGKYYCDEEENGWETEKAGLGCSLGKDVFVGGNNFCCPDGKTCNDVPGGAFKCEYSNVICGDFDGDEDGCSDARCVWFDDKCLTSLDDYGCMYYEQEAVDDEANCEKDDNNFWRNEPGADRCGGVIECEIDSLSAFLSVPMDKCGCRWEDGADDGQKCQFKMTAMQMITESGTPKELSCAVVYTLGECDKDKGEQSVKWTSTVFGESSGVDPACGVALGCVSGNGVRSCGEPIVKVPGFSLFAFFASLLVVAGYYVFRKD